MEIDEGLFRENLERIHKFLNTVDNDCHADALTSLNYLICKVDSEASSTTLDGWYNPEGDQEHPVFTREDWRTEVGDQGTVLGYWDWVEAQIREYLSDELKWP